MWIEKDQVPVIIFTPLHRIEAVMYTYRDARVLDELNTQTKPFIALTNVKVYSVSQDKLLYESEFMALNKNNIVNLLPKHELY
jgi:hypothetical protein